MAVKHFIEAIAQRFGTISRKERVAKVQKLASASVEDENFIRKTFPDLYKEAFLSPRRVAGGPSGATRRRVRSAAHR